MNQQQTIRQRRSPFDDYEQKQEAIKKQEQEIVRQEEEKIEQEEDYEVEVVAPKPVATKKTQKVVQRQTYVPQNNDDRGKYTATMEESLRRRIKVYCAQNGKMFSKFIEEACIEKLNREGYR